MSTCSASRVRNIRDSGPHLHRQSGSTRTLLTASYVSRLSGLVHIATKTRFYGLRYIPVTVKSFVRIKTIQVTITIIEDNNIFSNMATFIA